MMIEGTVQVSGTVSMDNSSFVRKYLENARRAKAKEDWEETEKYYNMVEQNDPSNIEAIFYSAYGKAKAALIENDIFKRKATFKVLKNCISIIDDNYKKGNERENQKIIEQISDDIIGMASSSYVYTQNKNSYGIVLSDNSSETQTLFNELNAEFCTSLSNIISVYSPRESDKTIYLYKLMIRHYQFVLDHGNLADKSAWIKSLEEAQLSLSIIDPTYIVPEDQYIGV